MSRKNKAFLQGLAVFLVLIAGSMLFKGASHLPDAATKLAANAKARANNLPPAEKDRYRKTVTFTPDADLKQSSRWMPGTVGTIAVWRDSRTGLVWGPGLREFALRGFRPEDLAQARAACAAQEPKGAWQLPLDFELDVAHRNGIVDVDKESYRSWYGYMYVNKRPVPLGRAWNPHFAELIYFVRCVARSE